MKSTSNKNHLSEQKSLYLRQHAENPVDWYPWSKAAFHRAKVENKIILVSIGYSACHWCHVMERESFENVETANFLNKNFVSIKVDREEFPDIDQYYQTLAQLTIGRGGWPLNVMLTPDGEAFFAGTYFPLVSQPGLPSFLELCNDVIKNYQNNPEQILKHASEVKIKLTELPRPPQKVNFEGDFPSASSILKALKQFEDEKNGGYGAAPKFPQFAYYEWAVEQILEGVIPQDLAQHILFSIERMVMGGMFDHAKGGIHRYSVDEKWNVPHFEKMLYDQAGLLKVLSKASLIYPSPILIDAMIMTIDYLKTEMLSESGYFFASQDADSEGVEGLYFCFTEEEFESALADFDETLIDRRDDLKKWFSVTNKGNFEHALNVIRLNPELKDQYLKPEAWELIRKTKQALLQARKMRIPPATDNKGIASWNFMMITALCDVIQYSKISVLRDNAQDLLNKCIDGIHQHFVKKYDDQNSLFLQHTTTLKHDYLFFEDYVALAQAHLRLYTMTGDESFRQSTVSLIKFTFETFYKDHDFYTKNVDEESGTLPNIPYALYDQSYASATQTFLRLLKNVNLLDHESKFVFQIPETQQVSRDFILLNPLAFGEGLRAFTYPLLAYKKFHIPRSWLKNEKFSELFPHFSSRFVFVYKDEEETWEICNSNACEIFGKNLEEFLTNLKGAKE